MKIIFYSTNSNYFNKNQVELFNYPMDSIEFSSFKNQCPKDKLYIVTQEPAFFLPENASALNSAADIFYLPQESSAQEVASKIIELEPDLVIAMTYWQSPFDWLTISDSIVAEILESKGIKTICHPLETAMICFDKNQTRAFFEQNKFNHPRSLFVDHDLFFCAGSNKAVISNVYKNSIFLQLRKMKLPLVIKDTTGVSSYSVDVVHTYGEAENYLNSKKNNSNRLIQEFADGIQIGVELYGNNGQYKVLPPFIFSVNKYGITSPKQSVKFSDGKTEGKQFQELKKQLLQLADKMKFNGAAQVDLVYKDGKWIFLEINPRLSGMTRSYCSGYGFNVYELITEYKNLGKMNPVLSIKLPPQEKVILEKLTCFSEIKKISQIYDKAAKQEREKGWCEIIFSAENLGEIKNGLKKVEEFFEKNKSLIPEALRPDKSIFEQSVSMLKSPLFPADC